MSSRQLQICCLAALLSVVATLATRVAGSTARPLLASHSEVLMLKIIALSCLLLVAASSAEKQADRRLLVFALFEKSGESISFKAVGVDNLLGVAYLCNYISTDRDNSFVRNEVSNGIICTVRNEHGSASLDFNLCAAGRALMVFGKKGPVTDLGTLPQGMWPDLKRPNECYFLIGVVASAGALPQTVEEVKGKSTAAYFKSMIESGALTFSEATRPE